MNSAASLILEKIIPTGNTGRVFCAFIALVLFQSIFDKAQAHSGGLNKYGCHAGKQPYHCHNGESSRSSSYGSGGSSFNSSPPLSSYTSSYSYSSPLGNDASADSEGENFLCPENYFSELLSQADNGRVYIRCDNSFILIQAN